MITRYDSVVVRTACKLLIPFMQVFALYVVFHGHESPGGGFQGGAILGASFILARLTQGPAPRSMFRGDGPLRWGAFGVLLFATIGFLPLFTGGNFLDYGTIRLPGLPQPELRALGILGIELGVAAGVTGVMVSIFDDLTPPSDEAPAASEGS